MLKRAMGIAMAFMGLIIGAGFASGQEVLQYFVSHGVDGVIGAVISGVIMIIGALAILQYGSYFRAREHTGVLGRVALPVTSTVLDVAVMVTLFATGFVMFAGAGSNLRQQFDLAIPWGSTIMLVLVLAAGMLDVDKVSRVIGSITPFILIFLFGASVYAIVTSDWNLGELGEFARGNAESAVGVWWLSALNYTGLAIMMGASMAIVIGGANLMPREAGIGGAVGGAAYAVFLILCTLALLLSVESVSDDPMPMLTLVNDIHPVLGYAMAIVIYGMIFNSAIGMFYALGKRLTATKPGRFRVVFITVTVIGYAISYIGFETLVNYVYPVLGYLGLLLIVVMVIGWARARGRITEEQGTRDTVHDLTKRELDPDGDYGEDERRRMREALGDSNIDDGELREAAFGTAAQELIDDSDVEFSEEDRDRIARERGYGADPGDPDAPDDSGDPGDDSGAAPAGTAPAPDRGDDAARRKDDHHA